MSSDYFSVHTHTQFSWLDGLDSVQATVNRIAELGQSAWVHTEHGTMGGTVQGYKASKKAGLLYFPGEEFYVVRDVTDPDTRGNRWHLGIMALDLKGYQALVRLSSLSWRADRFYRKPLIDLSDLAFLSEEGYAPHLAVTTGCYFGLVVNKWQGQNPEKHAGAMIGMLQSWFPNLYVELQDHGVVHDDGTTDQQIARALHGLATTRGLPVVLGGDSHYVHAHDQAAHDLMKDICYFGDGEDNHFPGGPYHLLSEDEAFRNFPEPIRDDLAEGHADLLNRHALSLPALDKYRLAVPKVSSNPDETLAVQSLARLEQKVGRSKEYLKRLDHELHVIKTMGMSDYFLLVMKHVTDWCREEGIIVNTRGSANGSLVCYALGITNVDPIKWGTSFDRFLSLDRMKPPDIDVDVDYRGRGRLVEHLRHVFPGILQIGTYANIGITEQVDENTGLGEDKGSIFVQYLAAMRRKVPNFDGKVLPEHRKALNLLSDLPAYKSMGTNAAGFILPAESLPIADYLPLARIVSSDTTVTQFSKDDVEALGYMKMDILGLKALQTLNGTLTRLGKRPNEWEWLPLDDKDACALLRSGNCVGLFQYEGFTSQRGGKEMKIKSTKDAIIGLALYRPALDRQRPVYLNNRFNKSNQIRLHPFFDPVLKDTLGVPLFQEQIMEMLKALKMQYQDWNDLMTAVKASNGNIAGARDTFDRVQPIFYDLCEDQGIMDANADLAWDAVVGFTEYGFNKAHATGYGLMSYYSAYLKAHYPLEYMASLLDVWAGHKDKEPLYVREAKRLGFSIVKADVNVSGVSWDIDKTRSNALRKGLVCLKGVGESVAEVIVNEREANGPYKDMNDFVDRTPRRPVTGGTDWKKKGTLIGVCETLRASGALRSLGCE